MGRALEHRGLFPADGKPARPPHAADAAFLVGVLFKKAHGRGIIFGIVAGVAFNLFLWLWFEDIYWMWWNLFGFLVTSVVALVVSAIITSPQREDVGEYVLNWNSILKEERRWMPTYGLLIFYFVLMLSFMLLVQWFIK